MFYRNILKWESEFSRWRLLKVTLIQTWENLQADKLGLPKISENAEDFSAEMLFFLLLLIILLAEEDSLMKTV